MCRSMSKIKTRQRKRRLKPDVAAIEPTTETQPVSESEPLDQALPDIEPTPLSLEEAAKQVLSYNDFGTFTIPAHGLYPHQWLWDSCFIAIGIRNYDIERAQVEILSMLRGQWHNGMVPHVILNPNPRDENGKRLRNAGIWRSWLNPNAPEDVSTSGITQPPLLAEAIVRIGEKM